jgi:hypothetical protein
MRSIVNIFISRSVHDGELPREVAAANGLVWKGHINDMRHRSSVSKWNEANGLGEAW